MAVLLDYQHVEVSFNGEPVVHDVSFQLHPGEILGLVGESGSGKSTLIKAAMGLLGSSGMVTRGDIWFEGKSLPDVPPKELRRICGEKIGMIFQDCGGTLNPIRRIGSQFVEYIRIHTDISKQEAWDKARSMLEKMRLPDSENIMKSYPHQLSGGMRQRVGIAIAMTFNPELLLADEPTSALDVTTQAQIVREMMELRDRFGTGIIIVTHNLGVAAYMADQLIVMQHGKVVDRGTRDEVMDHPTSEYTRNLLQSVPELEGRRFV